MVSRKQELTKFLIWMRNGISFVVTWFLILLLAGSHMLNIPTITVSGLTKLVILVAGGVFLFCLSFTKLFLLRWSFLARLSFFIGAISVYQIAAFYWLGLFVDSGTVLQWVIYAGIILTSYLCSVLIYCVCYKKDGKAYTQALNAYQKKRRDYHGK